MPAPRPDAAAGRHFDYARERTPALQSRSDQDQAYKWHNFIQASAWGHPESERGEVVSEEWMQNNLPDLDRPWEPHESDRDSEKDPKLWQKGGWKRWKQRHYVCTISLLAEPIRCAAPEVERGFCLELVL